MTKVFLAITFVLGLAGQIIISPHPSSSSGGSLPSPWTIDSSSLIGPQIKTNTAFFGTADPDKCNGFIVVCIGRESQGTSTEWYNNTYSTDNAELSILLEDDGRVYLSASDEIYISAVNEMTVQGGSIDLFSDTAELDFTATTSKIIVYSPGPSFSQHLDAVTLNTATPPTATFQGSYKSSDGTAGFTGTCTILGLTSITVKVGLVTSCS